jgi:hypothetical protein
LCILLKEFTACESIHDQAQWINASFAQKSFEIYGDLNTPEIPHQIKGYSNVSREGSDWTRGENEPMAADRRATRRVTSISSWSKFLCPPPQFSHSVIACTQDETLYTL